MKRTPIIEQLTCKSICGKLYRSDKQLFHDCLKCVYFLYKLLNCLQTTMRVRAHADDVNAVCYAEDSPNIIVTGSDDSLIKV